MKQKNIWPVCKKTNIQTALSAKAQDQTTAALSVGSALWSVICMLKNGLQLPSLYCIRSEVI